MNSYHDGICRIGSEGRLAAGAGGQGTARRYWDGGRSRTTLPARETPGPPERRRLTQPRLQLGTGAITTAISGLRGDTLYYYRYYAVNASGGQWSPAAASFRTQLNWHEFGRQMKISVMDTVTGVWKYVVYTRSGTNGQFLVDGARVGVPIGNAGGPVSGADLYLGAAHWSDTFKGMLDETRIASLARSTNWVWAEYMNIASNSAFLAFEAPANLKFGLAILIQ